MANDKSSGIGFELRGVVYRSVFRVALLHTANNVFPSAILHK